MEFNSSKPIFNQIADYFRRLITLGIYKEGDSLPSVRDFALAEKVNPNTVQKSYQLLVDEGLVSSLPKKGYFVSNKSVPIDKTELEERIHAILNDGYSKEDIINVLNEMEGK